MLTISENLKDANKAILEAQNEYQKVAREVFVKHSKEIFDKYPTVKSISWAQYTPYFNDGDECVFSVRTGYFGITLVDGTKLDKVDIWEFQQAINSGTTTWTYTDYSEKRQQTDEEWAKFKRDNSWAKDSYRASTPITVSKRVTEDIQPYQYASVEMDALLHSINSDAMKLMFGDHVEVTLYNDGSVTTEEFEHD